ncbi:MAG: hypothetical protein ABUS51_10445 [Acidobacteriota bacterium]
MLLPDINMEERNPKTSHEGGILKATAVALGGAAGQLAALAMSVRAGEAVSPPPTPKRKGRLPKKNKARLPRREKKQLAKEAA